MSDLAQETTTFRAYAKINLSLEILQKRPDGFHEIASVMQTVGLYDTLRIGLSEDLLFDCNIAELVTEDNLVWQAALKLLEYCGPGSQRGADIFLEKAIPQAAGLGGGSSDAATTLLALDHLWELHLGQEQLLELAAELGSDVPFFLKGGTALAEGRGEILTELPSIPDSWLVLVYPPLPMPENKTKELYKLLDRSDFSQGGVTRALVSALKQGERPPPSLLHNSFERVVYERFPHLDYFRQTMVEAGADYVRVSGSGPALFSLMAYQHEAQEIADRLTQANFFAYAIPTIAG